MNNLDEDKLLNDITQHLQEKVDQIYALYQERFYIVSGDIAPHHAAEQDMQTRVLAKTIKRVLMEQMGSE